MQRMNRKAVFAGMMVANLMLASLLCMGCSNSTMTEAPAEKTAGGSAALKHIDTASLPKLDEYLPPLDEGRVEVAPPQGWHRMPKTAPYLCSFTEEKGGRLPAIIVVAGDPPVTGFDTVTEENVAEFADALQATLKEPLEPAQPIVIGTNSFARYVKQARLKNVSAEVQVLATIQNGRMYTVELQVIAHAILAHRDRGYAVGGGLKFPLLGGGVKSETPAEQPATTSEPPAKEAAASEAAAKE